MVAVAQIPTAALAVLVSLGVGSIASAQASQPGTIDSSIQVQVTDARWLALKKLRSASCRRIFGDFEDLDGQRLDKVLTTLNETAQGRLQRLNFRDGSKTSTCSKPGVFAFTSPGSLTIFVCPAFARIARLEPSVTATILLHEELHSLGAGEAPMAGLLSAEEITARIERRCGR